MMLRKHVLGAIALLCSAPVLANVPIESRGLSQSSSSYSSNTPAAYASGSSSADSTPVSTNLNWQLMQKNQQLENDLRTLRGKIEEQDNEISQLKNELTNRYADLDQRLELLQQKVDPASEDSHAEDNQQDTAPSGTASQPAALKSPAAASAATPVHTPAIQPPSAGSTPRKQPPNWIKPPILLPWMLISKAAPRKPLRQCRTLSKTTQTACISAMPTFGWQNSTLQLNQPTMQKRSATTALLSTNIPTHHAPHGHCISFTA